MPIVILLTALFKIFGIGLALDQLVAKPLNRSRSGAEFAFVVLGLGLLGNLFLALIGLSLITIHQFSLLIAALACAYVLVKSRFKFPQPNSLGLLVGSGVLFILIAFQLVAIPSRCWDANMIWFFFSKMIWCHSSLWGAKASFLNPAYGFSHPDYPKLVSLVGAELVQSLGVWNEYIPRLALIFLFMAAWSGFLHFRRRNWVSILFMAFCFLKLGDLMWYGCVDAYLVLFGIIACLYFADFLRHGMTAEFTYGCLALALCGCIKNEGLLIIVSVFISLAVVLYRQNRLMQVKKLWPCFLLFVPVVLWQILRLTWGVHNDLALGQSSAVSMSWHRLHHWSDIAFIFRGIFTFGELGRTVIVAIFLAYGWLKWRRNLKNPYAFIALSASLYLMGLFVVYLSTPHDLRWHINESVVRTTLWPMLMVFVMMWWMAEDLYT